MEEFDPRSLPFLTRNMLAFDHGLAFGLRLQTQTNQAVNLTVRGMTREGVFTFSFATNGNGELQSANFRIPDLPIMVSVTNPDGEFEQGDCFVSLSLTSSDDVLHELCSGFVYSQKSISYPAASNVDARPNGGRLRVASSSNPAAGAELSITVPGGRFWLVRAVRFQLVAAAAAASRRVHLVFSSSSTPLFEAFSSVDQIISETRNYSAAHFGAGLDELDDNDILIHIPDFVFVPEDGTITTETTALNAGDNFGVMSVTVEEFYKPS